MFEFYQRNYPTGQRGKTGNTPKRSHPDDQRTVFYVPPYPSVTQGIPWTRFAIRGARVVAEHAQNAPVESVESRRAIVIRAHVGLNAGYNLARSSLHHASAIRSALL
jgi:hypothetical protein